MSERMTSVSIGKNMRPSVGRSYSTRNVHETAEAFFSEAMSNYIEQDRQRPDKQWVNNILDGKSEKEGVIYEDPEFLVLFDTKKKNKVRNLQELQMYRESPAGAHVLGRDFVLHWLVLTRDTELRCIRDLTGDHVPLLERIQSTCESLLLEYFGIEKNMIKIFAHYHPSVYQLHFHVDYPSGRMTGSHPSRVKSMHDILNNLKTDPMYYHHHTIECPVRINQLLFKISSGEMLKDN